MRSFRIFFCALLAGVASAFLPAKAQRTVWAAMLPDAYANLSASAAVTDSAGNTYVVGRFMGRLQTDGLTIQSAYPRDVDTYYAKYNAQGRVQWLIRAGAADTSRATTETPRAIALDGQGHLFVSGYMGSANSRWSLGTFTDTLGGNYLAKLNTVTGQAIWVRRLEGNGRSAQSRNRRAYVNGLGCDASGRLYMSLQGDRLDSLGNLPTAVTSSGLLIACCDGNGVFTWNTPLYCQQTVPQAVFQLDGFAVSPQGDVAVSGILHGTMLVGSLTAPAFTVPSTDTGTVGYFWDAFVARFHSDGTPRWARLVDGPSGQSVLGMSFDAPGNLVLTGRGYGETRSGTFTTPPGQFVGKLDAAGNPLWLRGTAGPSHDAATFAVTTDAAGNAYTVGWFFGTMSLDGFPLTGDISGTYNSSLFVASYTPTGVVRWAKTASGNQSMGTATGCGIGRDAAGHLYVSGSNIPTQSEPSRDYDGLTVKGKCAFLLRFDEAARITGHAYLDQNANGQRDPSEIAFPRPLLVNETGRRYAATTSPSNGCFTIFADTGAYRVSISQAPAYYTVRQGAAGYTGHLRTYGQTDSARHFGLAPIANQPDVRVTLTPYSAARRGFVNRYRARVENVGTTVTSGALTVQLDAALTYSGATPPPAQQSGTSATWSFVGLAPFGTRDFDISATIPLNVALGTVIHSRATVAVAGDLDPANDVDSVRQTVIGSWDPNDLTVNYTSLTPAQIAAGTVLDYVVRFQNLGTDTAFTVVIHDSLPAGLLQLGTLQLVGQSHNCWWNILGNNTLVVRFDNINLPPNATNALSSAGFVRFQVTPRATLTPGMLIPNQAHIVFDFNAPLATNGVTTLVQTPNGLVAAPGAADASMRLYPNPADRTARVRIESAAAAEATVFDALGRPVRRALLTDSALTLDGLAPGVYVVRLTQLDGHTVSRRLVVR